MVKNNFVVCYYLNICNLSIEWKRWCSEYLCELVLEHDWHKIVDQTTVT